LNVRLSKHKDLSCSSKQIISRNNYYIEQIDSTFDEEESVMLERYYIETFECVNELIPGRSRKEYLEENPEYYKEYMKKWRKDNTEYMKEWSKKYYEKNKDKILEKMKKKYTCECGTTLRKDGKLDHEKSKRHINFINSK
jgi:hypothetical protein